METPSDLKTLTFHGADVGREALSTVSRYLHEGGVDLADPRSQALLRELLPAAVKTALAAESLFDELEPELSAPRTSATTPIRARCATSRCCAA